MARYTDAKCRQCRRVGEKLFLKGEKCFSNCTLEKRPNPPGPRPARRRKVSDRGLQLREKQKARFTYGVLERQFRRYYENAIRLPGVSGENLVIQLETRLDNVVYRLGLADSRNQARQIVRHGHIRLNGRKTNIPSAHVKVGDEVAFTDRGQKSEYFAIQKEAIKGKEIPNWLSVDREEMKGRVLTIPSLGEVDHTFNENVIIEYYSR